MCLAVHANAASAGQGGRDEQRRQQDEQIATTFGKRSGDKGEFFVLRFTSKKPAMISSRWATCIKA
ncbi:hypothetical protein [Paraburkholderia fungorum]|uniref:hypothetical protein n=1 Tax=Paraburkholderia fungorum TaxID=134537 RepID=UPI0004A9E8BF|nr:hypothetical protein [Paraburkholderia fungorum]KFX66978.1 hypothetical protein KBK24_0101890 [Burkholderia sp. K24]USX04613.1 hypothetical protein NHH62_15930 [Paraburkholderia fungorum]